MAETFEDFFRRATGGSDPYPYQGRFAEAPEVPHLLRAPTGAGKTATAVLGWLYRWQAKRPGTPRRLVYCLPMRVLVEQSFAATLGWLHRLDLLDAQPDFAPGDPKQVAAYRPRLDEAAAGRVAVYRLMGGVDTEQWYLHPERPAVLIGTQDMLLSRALNRGYAASRFHWPIDYSLLNNDCLWVFDEPQLMGNGVSTSAQLAGLRAKLGTFGPCPSVWMSATLEPGWLDTVDFRGHFPTPPLELTTEDYDPALPLHKRMTAVKTLGRLDAEATKDGKPVAKAVWEKHHQPGAQTLVVLNTVERAKAVYAELVKLRKKAESPKLLLVHSRFRPAERERLNEALTDKAAGDRIIVATQVVEAGVDISARTLVTELAPWASVVQRIGRCNRTGDDGPGQVFWINLDTDKQAAPYEKADLEAARERLNKLAGADVSPKSLEPYRLDPTYPHTHVVRRRDVLDLFDTAPDLSGNDIDVGRFVRSDDDGTDVQVFWRVGAPSDDWEAPERRRQAARREELCNVPIGRFKKEFLEAGKTAYRWDFLDKEWREVGKRDVGTVTPGQTFWVRIAEGGYDRQLGWTPSAGPMPMDFPLPLPAKPPMIGPDEFDGDDWSMLGWRTIARHTDEVVAELAKVVGAIGLAGDAAAALGLAARWHDWGKIHGVFQGAIGQQGRHPEALRAWREKRGPEPAFEPRPDRWREAPDLAKAPDGFWGRYERKRFRHEAASALGVLSARSAGAPLPGWAESPSVIDLAVYLIASHHGKVRLAIRAMPGEVPSGNPEDLFVCGLREKDEMPPVSLGGGQAAPAVNLDLSPMRLGGENSWTGKALQLLNDLGPFRLAYLEALLRAADCRASARADAEGDDA